MQTRAALLWGVGQDWKIEDIDLHPPKAGEVLIKLEAAGLCHSDEHFVTGDIVVPDPIREQVGFPEVFPIVGGHEGAGVVVEVGPGVTSVAPGDRVAASFIPSCRHCRWCLTGRPALCDLGARALVKGQITDGTVRHFCNGVELNTMANLGTFAEHTVVAEASVVKVDPEVSAVAAALVSCGVTTGWGSAVERAGVRPGETVVVIGVGGVGMNAVQGARMMGAQRIVAVDLVEFRQKASLDFGATHTAGSIEEAIPLVTELTRGEMAERVVLAAGVVTKDLLAGALQLTGKGGTCALTGLAPIMQTEVTLNLFELAMWSKEIKGVLFGGGNPQIDIPRLLALYKNGQLMLDELVTRTYTLDELNQGYQDMRDGNNLRGVVVF